MMTDLVPTGVAVTETSTDVAAPLFAAEATVIGGAVDSRRREFITGRHCAHSALMSLGLPAIPILSRRPGGPQWPPGVVGSITHCRGYRGAAVALSRDHVAVGIDAEPHEPLPADIHATVLTRQERGWTRERRDGVHWGRVLFSIKESVFKAWNPLTGHWPDFQDVDVWCDPAGSFSAQLAPHAAGREGLSLAGRWAVDHGIILSALTIPASDDT